MNTKFVNVLKQKDGVALMSVLLFFTVMTLLLGAASFAAVANARQSGANSRSMAAFYAAEAGITRVVHEFRQIYEDNSLNRGDVAFELIGIHDYFMSNPEIVLSNNEGVAVTANISFESFNLDLNNSVLTATISSQGQVGSNTRTLRKEITFNFGDAGNFLVRHGVLVSHTITASGTITSTDPLNSEKRPRIATMQTNASAININGLTFPNGIAETGVQVTFPKISFDQIRNTANNLFPLSQTTFTHGNLQGALSSGNVLNGGNYFVNHLDFGAVANAGVSRITVRAGEHAFIVTNRLTLGSVNIVGDGRVTIYVRQGTNTFSPNDNGTDFGRLTREDKLAVYIDTINGVGGNAYHVDFLNNSKTRGYFMFENARIQFRQNAELWGGLFTGAHNGSGNSVDAIRLRNNARLNSRGGRSLLVAPNGRVFFENNSTMTGAVIARDFFMSGANTALTFDPDLPTVIPFEITSPNPLGSGTGSTAGRSFSTSPTIEK